jgi:hypothetical protein
MARRRTVSRVHSLQTLLAELTTLGQNTLPGLGQKASAWISELRAHRGKFGQRVTCMLSTVNGALHSGGQFAPSLESQKMLAKG